MIKCRLDCDTEWAPTQQNNFTFIPGGSIHDVAVYYIILPSIHLTRLLNLKVSYSFKQRAYNLIFKRNANRSSQTVVSDG